MSLSTKRRFLSGWICLLGLITLATDPACAAKLFRWKLAAGDSFEVEMTQQMKQTTTSGDQTYEVPTTMVMFMDWTVQGVSDEGTIDMTQTIRRIIITTQVPNVGEVRFDSDANDRPEGIVKMMSDMMKPMVGAKFVEKMDDRGRILDLKIPPEALQGLAANPIMQQFFSEQAFKDQMTQAAPVLPAEEIDIGHRWQKDSENDTPSGKMKMTVTYIYEGEEERQGKPLEKFAAELAVSLEEGGGQAGAKTRIVDQNNSGSLYFDRAAGHFVETNLEQELTMEITFGEQSINQKLESKGKMIVKRGMKQ